LAHPREKAKNYVPWEEFEPWFPTSKSQGLTTTVYMFFFVDVKVHEVCFL
jgi:hypothetical protein